MPSTLILITGQPATGKTSLALKLSDKLHIPLVSKDALKEILFDTIGVGDRDWSMKLGRSSFVLVDYVVEAQLKAGNTIILESPLIPKFEDKKFQDWQLKYNFRAVQVICHGESNAIVERFASRALSDDRHVGHQDAENIKEFREKLQQPLGEQRIDIDSTVVKVDTTDFAKVDYDAICERIGAIVESYKYTAQN